MKKNSLSVRTRYWLLLPVNIILFIIFTTYNYIKSIVLLPVTLYKYLENMYYKELLDELEIGLFPTDGYKIYLDKNTIAVEDGDEFVLYDGGKK